MQFKFKVFIALGILLVLVINMPIIATAVIQGQAKSRIHETVNDVSVSEAALVLGAAAYSPTNLSDILRDRVDTGIELYRAGKVKSLIMSGASNEVVAMANYALNKGVPQGRIYGDQNGYNTFASIANVAGDYETLVIVTQEYHLPRAIFYARNFGIEATGLKADKRAYQKIKEFKKRELIAQAKAFVDVYLFSWLLPYEKTMELNKKLGELG